MSADVIKGNAALDNRDYKSAIQYFSEALKLSQAPSWLLKRSTAYHRLGQHELALTDANKALIIAIDRGKRELIADAHFRRGIVLHGLKQYGNARMCFYWSRKFNEKIPGLNMWITKVKNDYNASGGDNASGNLITIKEVPDKVDEIEQNTPSSQLSDLDKVDEDYKSSSSSRQMAMSKLNSKIRHEWYQSHSTVTVEILAKAIPKQDISINMLERSLDVSFPVPSSQNLYNLSLEPLFSKIEVEKSNYHVTPHKIEINMLKSDPGLKWPTLESTESVSVVKATVPIQEGKDSSGETKELSQVLMYPTSSKTGPKNWDTLVGKESEEDDAESPDAFFKMLYKNADPDTKRAMVKSYQESNGTSLSTQWSDVGSRKFEIIPPEGVEVKKWNT